MRKPIASLSYCPFDFPFINRKMTFVIFSVGFITLKITVIRSALSLTRDFKPRIDETDEQLF
jgi:hypothetical protein